MDAMVQKMKKQLSGPCQGATPMIAWQGPVKKEGYEETLYQRQAAIAFDGQSIVGKALRNLEGLKVLAFDHVRMPE